MSSRDLHDLGVAELAASIAAGKVSSVEATQHFLSRIARHQALGAFLATGVGVWHSLRGRRFQTWSPAASARSVDTG